MDAICRSKPFDPWLLAEMRSNHAGETGAVRIYDGALWALSVRRKARCSGGAVGDALLGGPWPKYEEQLRDFATEHRASEAEHAVLLDAVLDDDEKSKLLPAWSAAGFVLGAISTLWCPRGMYVTTEAVEAFVEGHYGEQIRRLGDEIGGVLETDGGNGTVIEEGGDRGADSRTEEVVVDGKKELLLMLEHCCADEVHHKEEARGRAAEGPLPWFEQVDTAWQALVGSGSAVAANLARRL